MERVNMVDTSGFHGEFGGGYDQSSGRGTFVQDRRRAMKGQRDVVVLGKLMAWRLEQSGHECDAELARLWYGALANLRQEAVK